jgi:hypothetical protein
MSLTHLVNLLEGAWKPEGSPVIQGLDGHCKQCMYIHTYIHTYLLDLDNTRCDVPDLGSTGGRFPTFQRALHIQFVLHCCCYSGTHKQAELNLGMQLRVPLLCTCSYHSDDGGTFYLRQ